MNWHGGPPQPELVDKIQTMQSCPPRVRPILWFLYPNVRHPPKGTMSTLGQCGQAGIGRHGPRGQCPHNSWRTPFWVHVHEIVVLPRCQQEGLSLEGHYALVRFFVWTLWVLSAGVCFNPSTGRALVLQTKQEPDPRSGSRSAVFPGALLVSIRCLSISGGTPGNSHGPWSKNVPCPHFWLVGRTPFDVARNNGKSEVMKLLQADSGGFSYSGPQLNGLPRINAGGHTQRNP